ncbi:MAG TPA: amino acid permease [Nocardioidaceae bacterium]|nr:amino acid permease [Nocardioidaceae bacterium]
MTTQQHDPSISEYGYQQELSRTLRKFASFAIGFSFISITTGIFTTYGAVLNSSGPLGIWTWPLVAVGVTAVALVFGLLASRIPLAGYAYQWMSRLANPTVGWILGWFMFAFLVVDVVAVDYAVASTVFPSLFGYAATTGNTWLVTGLVALAQACVIGASTVLTERVNSIAVGTEIVGIVGLTVLLLVVGAIRGMLSGPNLFDKAALAHHAGYFGFGSATHAGPWVLAFLLGAFTIVGFDAASNLSEETQDAHKVVPRAMWTSVVISGVIGMGFLIAITVAADNFGKLAASGTPVADVVVAVLGGVVGKIFLVIVAYSIFACGMIIFVSATRLVWAMSRDNRFPGYTELRKVHPRLNTPLAATLTTGVVIEVVLAVFARSTDALFQLFSAATLMPCLLYLVTVILYVVTRSRLPESRGFSLGRWEPAVITVALVWLLFELSIFRDASFHKPWLYVVVMIAIGLVYLVWMLARGRSLEMPKADTDFDHAIQEVTGPRSGSPETT